MRSTIYECNRSGPNFDRADKNSHGSYFKNSYLKFDATKTVFFFQFKYRKISLTKIWTLARPIQDEDYTGDEGGFVTLFDVKRTKIR